MSTIIPEKGVLKKGKKIFLYCEVGDDYGTEVTIMLGKVLTIQNQGNRTVVKVPKKDLFCWQPPDRPVFEE